MIFSPGRTRYNSLLRSYGIVNAISIMSFLFSGLFLWIMGAIFHLRSGMFLKPIPSNFDFDRSDICNNQVPIAARIIFWSQSNFTPGFTPYRPQTVLQKSYQDLDCLRLVFKLMLSTQPVIGWCCWCVNPVGLERHRVCTYLKYHLTCFQR